jgi:hypothetical protein
MPSNYYYISTRPAHRNPSKVATYRVETGEGNIVARITFIGNAADYDVEHLSVMHAIGCSEELVGSGRPTKRGVFKRIATKPVAPRGRVPVR